MSRIVLTQEMSEFTFNYFAKQSRLIVIFVLLLAVIAPIMIADTFDFLPFPYFWRFIISFVVLVLVYIFIHYRMKRSRKKPAQDPKTKQEQVCDVWIDDEGIQWQQNGTGGMINYHAIDKVVRKDNILLVISSQSSYIVLDWDQLDENERNLIGQHVINR